ncbi:unnamed protein product [Toxocara canis]|uniref:Uncharacterized protein n=1 Tax=Toxocara canis TaxID=6265 RepID=A0A183V2M6_TOXCA|nr:unnamed protein product [Toxocara canis]
MQQLRQGRNAWQSSCNGIDDVVCGVWRGEDVLHGRNAHRMLRLWRKCLHIFVMEHFHESTRRLSVPGVSQHELRAKCRNGSA